MRHSLLTPHIRTTLQQWARHQLALPALLLLAGNRPLAFMAGQTLAAGAPLAGLFDLTGWDEWAALLSSHDGAAELEAWLAQEAAHPSAGGSR